MGRPGEQPPPPLPRPAARSGEMPAAAAAAQSPGRRPAGLDPVPAGSRGPPRSSPGPAAAAAPAGAGTERAAAPRRGPEERARERERCRPPRMMWVPLLACLTAGIVSVPKCQRGPGALLGAARLLAAVPGLCQRRKLPSPSGCFAVPFGLVGVVVGVWFSRGGPCVGGGHARARRLPPGAQP